MVLPIPTLGIRVWIRLGGLSTTAVAIANVSAAERRVQVEASAVLGASGALTALASPCRVLASPLILTGTPT